MEKIKYAVLPRFTMKKKGKVIDTESIETEFRNWIKQYTAQGYIISRPTSLLAVMEPGCFSRLILKEKVAFVDFSALEFKKSDEKLDYHYQIAPHFVVKSQRISKKEKKIAKKDPGKYGVILFEKNREEFEKLINNFINKISSQGLQYNTSTEISVTIQPGCLGVLMRKKAEDIDFEAYEFIKTSTPTQYKCKVFPIYKSKWATFSFADFEKDFSNKASAEIEQGYEPVGKIKFGGYIVTGCLGKGETVQIDAFLYRKV